MPKILVYVSSVSVYGLEEGVEITEEYPLNGNSSYARSKIFAEQLLVDWCRLNDVVLSVIRPSLIVGKDAPGNLGAMVRGIKKGFYCRISGVETQKSLVLAEDIAKAIPVLSEKGGIYNFCGSYNPTIRELEDVIMLRLGKKHIVSLPYWSVKIISKIGNLFGPGFPINSRKLGKLTKSLTFSNEKARRELGWEPRDVIKHFEI